MQYPAIVYEVDDLEVQWADNLAYFQEIKYQVTVIQQDPDDDLWLKVGRLPKSAFNRHEVVDNLHHYYFTLSF